MSYIIGAFVEWYVLCWILACFPLVLLIGIMFWPETPVWLLAHDREDDARKSLQRLRGKCVLTTLIWTYETYVMLLFRRTPVEAELQRIKQNQEKTKQNGVQQKIKPRELMKGFVLKPLGLSMGIMFFQQYTGINAVVYYTVSIFQSAGSTMEPRFAAIIVGFVQFVFTAISGLFVSSIAFKINLRFVQKLFLVLGGPFWKTDFASCVRLHSDSLDGSHGHLFLLSETMGRRGSNCDTWLASSCLIDGLLCFLFKWLRQRSLYLDGGAVTRSLSIHFGSH